MSVAARVHFVLEDDLTQELLDRYEELLSPEERVAERRYVFERDRKRYRATRALVKTTLAEYVPEIAPPDFTFALGRWGRPDIHPDHGVPWLRFNLSHTPGAIVMLVSRGPEVGIDVEDRHRKGHTTEIAERFFSPAEVEELRAAPPSEQKDRFFWYWTLKESYIKARGMGLSLPLDAFSFTVDPPELGFACDPRCEDDADRWAFSIHALTDRHVVSLALERVTGEQASVSFVRTVPHATSQPVELERLRASKDAFR